jgi:hypothetical protein
MPEELREFRELVDSADEHRPSLGMPAPPNEEDVARCIQMMLARQCIYPDMYGVGHYYRILSTEKYQSFFRKYFAAMGLELHQDMRSGMIALRAPADAPRYDLRSARLRKDETAVLLALRIAYEEAFSNKTMGETGRVETSTDDLYDKLSTIGHMELEEPRLMEILEFLKRKGVVEIGDFDPVERIHPLTILPGVEVMVPASYMQRVINAAETVRAGDTAKPEDGVLADPELPDADADEEPR